MKKALNLFLLLISLLSFSQIKFKEGYIITNDGLKKNCLIKDMAWKDYPESFLYKEDENSEVKKAYLQNVKEFYVDETKYVRFYFKIDNSPTNLNAIGTDKNPIWIEKTAFLKLLVDGETQLYKFSKNGDVKYFIKNSHNEKIAQLVFKKYFVEKDNQSFIKNNDFYKAQLDSINKNINTSELKYNDKKLIYWFSQNNNKDFKEVIKKENGKLNLRLKPFLISSNMKYKENNEHFNFENKFNFTASIELEYIFGFNKSKWSVFTEPTYYQYSGEKTIENVFYTMITKTSYSINNQSIILPLGIKHYMFLNNDNKVFLSSAFVINIPFNYNIKIWNPTTNTTSYDDDFSTFSGIQIGIGYTHKNKFSIEGKYISQKSHVGLFGKLTNNIYLAGLSYNIF